MLKFLAAELRLASTGSLASAAAPSLAIAGRSCSSNPGSRWIDTRRLESWAAVSRAVLPASTMNRLTCLELLASAVTTESESAVSCWRVCESLASRLSRLSVSVSAGTARRSAP